MINETIIRNSLDFLCSDYGFKYKTTEYQNYLNSNAVLITHNYYNENGCFTIALIPVIGEESFLKFDSIELIDQYFKYSNSFYGQDLNVFNYVPQIWGKYDKIFGFNNPFAWASSKRFMRVLCEVIVSQIEAEGGFFGIKIK